MTATGFTCGRCGHNWRHHTGKGGVGDCRTVAIGGPATPADYLGAAAELHMGRTITRCDCTRWRPGGAG